MRRQRLALAAGTMLFAAAPAQAQGRGAVAAAAAMDSMADAIRRQDGAKMLRTYADSGLIYSSHGMLVTSRPALDSVYGAWDSTKTRGSVMIWQDRRYEVLGPRAVLATARFRLAIGNRTGTPADTTIGTWTGVFVKRNGRWVLFHEHESFAAPQSRGDSR